MSKVRVGDIVEILNGYAFDSNYFNSNGRGLPVIRVRDVTPGTSRTYTTEACSEDYSIYNGDLLIGMDGEFNIEFWKGGKALLNQRVCKVTGKDGIADDTFLKYRLGQLLKTIEVNTPFVTVKHLSSEKLKKEEIDLPPLDEQKRIAAILSKADRLRRLRRYARELSDGYLQAVFLEMFGDPVSNPRGWERVPLDKLGKVQGGLQLSSKRNELELKAPYLRVANVYRSRLELAEIKMLRLTQEEFERTQLKKGDVLIVEGHGNINEIGRSAIWDGSIPKCVHQNHLIRVRVKSEVIKNIYLDRYINSSFGRNYFTNSSNTTSGLNTISTSTVKRLPVALPPLPLQQKFAHIVHKYERLRAQQREAERQAEHLFQSLLDRAFRGELGQGEATQSPADSVDPKGFVA